MSAPVDRWRQSIQWFGHDHATPLALPCPAGEWVRFDDHETALAAARAEGLRMAADHFAAMANAARANLEAVGLDAIGDERTTFNWLRWAEKQVRALLSLEPPA